MRAAASAAKIAALTFDWSLLMLLMLRRFLRDESAIAVTEYGLLVALIAVLLIAVVMIFGSSIASWFSARTSTITTV